MYEIPEVSQKEIERYKQECDGRNVKVKRTYNNGFLVTNIYPILDETERREKRIDVTEGLIALMDKFKNFRNS